MITRRIAATTLLLLLAIIASLAAGCRRNRSDAFVMALESAPGSINPLLKNDASSDRFRQLMFNTLVHKNEHFEYVGELASNIVTASDGLSVTFTLRDNVKFHNGKPLTSADVKYTFDTLFTTDSPKAASFFESAPSGNQASNPNSSGNASAKLVKQPIVTGIEAPDAKTVIFRLRKPWTELLANCTPVAIIPEGSFSSQVNQPLGSGPFKFVSYDSAQQVVDMQSNEEYWEGAPGIKHLRVRVILDANTQQAELRSGSIDLAINTALTPDAYLSLGQTSSLQLVQTPGSNVQYVLFNTQAAPLNDARVRQAIAYAIDRESIVKSLLLDQARIAHSILPPESWAYAQGQQYNYDPQKAKKLLDDAGFRDPDGDGPQPRFSTPIVMKISASNAVVRQFASVIQNSLKEVGIPVSIESLEDNTLRDAQRNGQFQLTTGRWVGGNQDPIFLRDLFITGGNFNRGRYSNPDLDKFLAEAVSTLDRERARTLYAQAQEIVSREMPMFPLWYFNNMVVAKKSVGNIKPDLSGDWRFVRNLTVQGR
ncbi:MAG TPA: ABC transporter substrate-binding protein [Pyrinomonadaceae bacterium]|nr:ABC transporter substrate-binding protein [Pyrinomonadaceae bacterium]